MSNIESSERGVLYLVATPIGNLGDLSPRAAEILGGVSLIAAEDTRHTRKLLSANDLATELLSYREHNHARVFQRILERLEEGLDVALVSDAGTPGISDPGQALVAAAVTRGLRVSPVPGACAAVAALAASGLPSDRFLFVGFPPRKTGALRRWAEGLAREPGSLILYESPQRIAKTLAVLAELWPERRAVVARELTKLHEEMDHGELSELASRWDREVKGELVLVVEGVGEDASEERLAPELERLMPLAAALRDGSPLSSKDTARLLADCLDVDKRQAYALVSRGLAPTAREED